MPPVTRSQTKGARLIQCYQLAYQTEQNWKKRLRDMHNRSLSLYDQDPNSVSARMNSLYTLYQATHNYLKHAHGSQYATLVRAFQKAIYELGTLTDDDPERLFKQLRRRQQVAKENLYGCMDDIPVL